MKLSNGGIPPTPVPLLRQTACGCVCRIAGWPSPPCIGNEPVVGRINASTLSPEVGHPPHLSWSVADSGSSELEELWCVLLLPPTIDAIVVIFIVLIITDIIPEAWMLYDYGGLGLVSLVPMHGTYFVLVF